MTPQAMTTQTCCEEFAATERARMGRRSFLRTATALGGAAAVTAAHGTAFTSTAYAAAPVDRVLVVLSMRGACDGLSLVVPHGDPVYYAARPGIAVPSTRLLAKDGFFGLHPALSPLLPWWNSGKLAAVHATGLPSPNRSHFSAMEEVEDADPGSDARVGWLNRLIGRNGTGSPVEAIQFGEGVPSAAISGPQPVLVSSDADSVALSAADDAASAAKRHQSMTRMWGDLPGPLAAGARTALDVVDQFAPVRNGPSAPANGAAYPGNSDLARALASAARTIRADVGAEVITVDHGSWDHHTWIGQPDDGNLRRMADEFALSLAAFLTDLGPLADRVTVVTLSEFGRRVKENANQGLDHGYGNVMFLVGAGVKGGRYYGTWPGLTNTTDADLLVTTDYRSVLSEVVVKRLGASSAAVFPGFTPESVGVMQV
jgi:uncharacterized protein (DUF1501 family)